MRIILVLIILVATQPMEAQEMHMHMHHPSSSPAKNIFLAVMDTMMMKMDEVPKATSPETDFIAQMIPHHEGAIEMAKYEIQNGKNFDMVQLAKSILAEQTNEIQQMQLWLKQARVSNHQIPAEHSENMDKTMTDMMKTMPANDQLINTDQAFALVMIPHHQAAVDMAKVVLKFSKDLQTTAFAKQLISNEQIEIEQMKTFSK